MAYEQKGEKEKAEADFAEAKRLGLGDNKTDAKSNAAKAQIGFLKIPIELFFVMYNRYPSSLDELEKPPPTANGVAAPFIEGKIPNDPWGNPYRYLVPGKHNAQSYDLYSLGPEGVESPNVIGNW